jgi:hypothetical protein
MFFLVKMWQDGPMPAKAEDKEKLRHDVIASLTKLSEWESKGKLKV